VSTIWSNILSNLIEGIVVALLSALVGLIGGYLLNMVEHRFLYARRQTKRLTRFIFSLLLTVGVILSPSQLDDAGNLYKAIASAPAGITASAVVSGSSRRTRKLNSKRVSQPQQKPPSLHTVSPVQPRRLSKYRASSAYRRLVSRNNHIRPKKPNKRKH